MTRRRQLRGPCSRRPFSRGSAALWGLTLLLALGLSVELLRPGHHVHGDGDARLHHHHFFLGEHGHGLELPEVWHQHTPQGHAAAHRHEHAGRDHESGRGPDRRGSGEGEESDPGSEDPSTSWLIDGLWSERARVEVASAVEAPLEAEASRAVEVPAPRAAARDSCSARGPPSSSFV